MSEQEKNSCGSYFCDYCGDCLHCYGDLECPSPLGCHYSEAAFQDYKKAEKEKNRDE